MKDHMQKFSFHSVGPEVDDRPSNPYVQITLDNYSTNRNGFIQLSSNLMSNDEIDSFKNEIVKDLNRACTMAKLELEKLNSRQKDSM